MYCRCRCDLRVDYFNDQSFWDTCDCDNFWHDYYRSIEMYFFADISVLFIAIIELIINIAFCCVRPPVDYVA